MAWQASVVVVAEWPYTDQYEYGAQSTLSITFECSTSGKPSLSALWRRMCKHEGGSPVPSEQRNFATRVGIGAGRVRIGRVKDDDNTNNVSATRKPCSASPRALAQVEIRDCTTCTTNQKSNDSANNSDNAPRIVRIVVVGQCGRRGHHEGLHRWKYFYRKSRRLHRDRRFV